MWRCLRKLNTQSGYSVIESMVVISVLTVVVGASIGLMQVGYWMDRQAEDGYAAQNEGRHVLSLMVRHMRPGENINSNEVPIVHAIDQGTVLDLRVDVDKDAIPEIVRFELERDEERIVMHIDRKDTSGATVGQYNYQKQSTDSYLEFYGEGSVTTPTTGLSYWDETVEIASKIVNAPPGGGYWDPQSAVSDPNEDFRLFTFYDQDFDVPLDTQNLDNWNNLVRGVKIYIWSDIQPAEIPSPFGIQTNVHLRNVQGDD